MAFRNKKREKLYIALIYIIILLLFWFVVPVGDDMMFHLLRVGELGKELERGSSFPVYMYRDVYYSFGYPIPIFYCGLFLCPFSVLVSWGVSAITAYKLLVIAILLFAFWSSYSCIYRWKKDSDYAFVGAFIYGLQPYFLIDLFVRAAIGEALVFIFVPIVLLGFWLVISGDNSLEGIICLALGVTGVVCSHVISTVLMVFALFVLFVAECINKKVNIISVVRILASALLCMLLSAWYVAPLLEQILSYEFRAESPGQFASGAVNILSLIIPMHMNIVLSSLVHTDLKPVQIGGAVIIMIAVVIYNVASGTFKKLSAKVRVLYILYFSLVFTLLIGWIWIPLGKIFGFIQFPWRIFIIISVIGTAAIILSIIEIREEKYRKSIVKISVLSAAYVLITFFTYFMARSALFNVSGGAVGTADTQIIYSTETSDDLYLNAVVNDSVFGEERVVVFSEDDKVDYNYNIDNTFGKVTLLLNENKSDEDLWAEFPFLMYRGYRAIDTNSYQEYQVSISDRGLVAVLIPAGTTGAIEVSYHGTMIQRVSYLASLIAGILLLAVMGGRVLYLCKRKNK